MKNKKRIVLITDNKSIKNLIERTLKTYGLIVHTFNTLKSFPKRLNEYRPDLIILDMDISNIDCKKFCDTLAKDDILMEMPVILLARRGELKHIEEALELCVYDYVYKPIEPIEIYERVKMLFNIQNKVESFIKKSKNKLFKATINTIHHEINQPLSVLLLSADLLESSIKGILNKMQHKYINKVRNSVFAINDIMYRVNMVSEENMEIIELNKDEEIIKLPVSSQRNAVFVIDDSKEIIEVIKDIAKDEGIEMFTASTLKEAQKILEKEHDKIKTILCDLKIKQKSGIELYHTMKKLDNNIKFYIITGYPLSKNDTIRSIKELKIPIITKPFTKRRILNLLK